MLVVVYSSRYQRRSAFASITPSGSVFGTLFALHISSVSMYLIERVMLFLYTNPPIEFCQSFRVAQSYMLGLVHAVTEHHSALMSKLEFLCGMLGLFY